MGAHEQLVLVLLQAAHGPKSMRHQSARDHHCARDQARGVILQVRSSFVNPLVQCRSHPENLSLASSRYRLLKSTQPQHYYFEIIPDEKTASKGIKGCKMNSKGQVVEGIDIFGSPTDSTLPFKNSLNFLRFHRLCAGNHARYLFRSEDSKDINAWIEGITYVPRNHPPAWQPV